MNPRLRNNESHNTTKKMSPSNKKSRPLLLERASQKLLEEDHKDVPVHFKSYSIQGQDIFCEKSKHIVDTYDDGIYEETAKVKEVNLALCQWTS